MQEIMGRKNTPPNVPFDEIASTGSAEEPSSANAYPPRGEWQDRLSPSDQRDFDRYYSQWIDDTRRNDRDEVSRDAGRLQEIMTRNNIPPMCPSIGVQVQYLIGRAVIRPRVSGHGRKDCPADDQREFDSNYAKWLEDTRKNDGTIDRDSLSGMYPLLSSQIILARSRFSIEGML
jgi:hypothetical protein